MDPNMSMSMNDEKFQMNVDHDHHDGNRLIKSRFMDQRRPLRLTTYIYPILLALLLIIGSVLLILTITRRNTCRQQQLEQTAALLGYKPDDNIKAWLPCLKTPFASCVCPASFIHSTVNPTHCIPSHSRCLKSCKHNPHCACYNLNDPISCGIVTRNFIENEFKTGAVERLRTPKPNPLLQNTWIDGFNEQLERSIVDVVAGERLFLSSDRRTGITIHEVHDDYLINEAWTKLEVNTTEQHVIYTQMNPIAHTCRMSFLREGGLITYGKVHTCPGNQMGAPYFFGVACNDILILWHGTRSLKLRQPEGTAMARHYFESTIPHLPVLLDPFHRYYSLYDDSMIEIKDLNGDVLAQLFTSIEQPTRFQFVDHLGSLLVANSTHMQNFRSLNEQSWLDF